MMTILMKRVMRSQPERKKKKPEFVTLKVPRDIFSNHCVVEMMDLCQHGTRDGRSHFEVMQDSRGPGCQPQ